MARRASRGFSLVEMLVAVAFMAVLMAGMASVFRAGLASFYTSGEKLASIRRNRVSLDLLYDDLNNAGMSMVDITSPLQASAQHPAFFIIPNVAIAGAGAAPDPQVTDELYLAFDQPLPFDGTLVTGGGAGTGDFAPQAVLTGQAMTTGSTDSSDDAYKIECGDPTYAQSVQSGMYFHIKDDLSHPPFQIKDATAVGTAVKIHVVSAISLATQVTGRGDPATLRSNQRIGNSSVVFIRPSQMVRYRILMLNLDPAKTGGIPCLVREQGTYDPSAAFNPDTTQTQVIAENVSGFKVYLSADSGANWAGSALGTSTTGFDSGWTSGIQAALNAQLAGTVKRQDYTTTSGKPGWYRDIPVLVRLDVTTRTATQRADYSAAGNQLAYKTLTQSLVLMPRHFGLPLN